MSSIEQPLAVSVINNGVEFTNSEPIFLPTQYFPNVLSPDFEKTLKEKNLIPEDAIVWIPESNYAVRTDWVSPGWFSIHDYAFSVGATLPFSPLMTYVIKVTKIMPCHLMPSIWKVICGVDVVCRKHDLEITVDDIKACWSFRNFGSSKVQFRIRSKRSPLIIGTDVRDYKDWTNGYMFVKADSISLELVDLDYTLKKKVGDWAYEKSEESEARIQKFLALDASERTWPSCLGKDIIPRAVIKTLAI